MFVEVVILTNNTQFKTLVNTWLNQKKPMITPSTHAIFKLIAENHLIPYFGKRKIGSITEADIQSYISYLYNAGRLDKTGGLTVKTIRDVILTKYVLPTTKITANSPIHCIYTGNQARTYTNTLTRLQRITTGGYLSQTTRKRLKISTMAFSRKALM